AHRRGLGDAHELEREVAVWAGTGHRRWILEFREKPLDFSRRSQPSDAPRRQGCGILAPAAEVRPQGEDEQRLASPEHIGERFSVAVPQLLTSAHAPGGAADEAR